MDSRAFLPPIEWGTSMSSASSDAAPKANSESGVATGHRAEEATPAPHTPEADLHPSPKFVAQKPVIRLTTNRDKPTQQLESSDTSQDDDYERVTGETLQRTLDIDSWDPAHRLAETYGRFER